MSEVQVHKIQAEGERASLLARQVDALYEEISLRAFLRFEARGGLPGFDREDWLEAERSLIFAPPAELVEKDDEFALRVAVPGFESSRIQVNVLPTQVIIDGDLSRPKPSEESVWLSEFNDQKLLRRVNLPSEVRTDTAKALLKDGILQISVQKVAQEAESRQQTVAAVA